MSSSATETHRFTVTPFAAKPVARISPEESTAILGSRITLSGAASTVQDSYEGLTLFWRLVTKPVDSEAVLVVSEISEKSVELEADITGTYIVSLYVEAAGVRSDTVTSAVFFSPAIVPAPKRLEIDGSFMFDVLSDFWTLVNDREIFPVVWSGMTQSVASDFLRAVQIDRAKSISTIQPLFQVRWISFSPQLLLDPEDLDIIYGGRQSGTGAFTGSVTFVGSAVVISAREVLISGQTTVRAIGTTMTLFSGSSRGSYLINKLNADGSGYIISEGTPFSGIEARITGTSLVAAISALDELTDISADFVAASVAIGDYVQILAGINADFYVVTEVVSTTKLRIDRPVRGRASNMRYRVLRAVRASFLSPQSAFTNTIYIPEEEADLPAFDLAPLRGSGAVTDNYRVILEPRHVIDSIIGAKIKLLTGSRAGSQFEIASISRDFGGIVVASPLGITASSEEISYEIIIAGGIQDRLIVLDGTAHRISSYELLTGLGTAEEGGRGNVWAVTLQEASAPSGREGIRWQICPTLRSDSIEDFEQLGISTGDMIEFEVMRDDLEIGSKFRAQVLGSSHEKVAFDFGTEALEFGLSGGQHYQGQIDDDDIARMAVELAIPTVTLSEEGEALFTSSAFEIYEILNSSDFKNTHKNLPVDPTTSIYIPSFFSFTVRPTRIIRNSRIPIGGFEHPVASIPALVEHISAPVSAEKDDGTFILTHKDDTTTSRTSAPIRMSENNEFVLTDTLIRGSALSTTVRSSQITIADKSLIANGIRPGDTLEITSGLSTGSYAITAVISNSVLRISGRIADGRLPVATQSAINYVIHRRGVGRFIEFYNSFTPALPAPDSLWAPLVFLDNYKYIEDNFGVLVQTTKEALDAYGTTQLSYKSAVAGLMYSWASGPTLGSAEIGSHILLDLPVTDKLCEIIQINPEYTENFGRVVVEELDFEGLGTGLVSVYRYPRSDLYSLEKFKGLGINSETGRTFAVGDILQPFTPLTNSVLVNDYITTPSWWREYSDVPGEVELQKYHTWQVEIDVQAVDSRDIPLAADFLNAIRPIYTKPTVVAILSLLDVITVQADLTLDLSMYFLDDPAFSRQSSHALDDYNGSSFALRKLDFRSMTDSFVLRKIDFGSMTGRTVFEGVDLVMSRGSGTITSARGGFTGELSTFTQINEYFDSSRYPDGVSVHGKNLVRPGDRVFVRSGPNEGSFIVQAVDSSTQLVVVQDVDPPSRGIEIAGIMDDSGAVFQIMRPQEVEICEGTSDDIEDSPFLVGNVFVDSTASFRSDGVTSDDRLIIVGGDNEGVYIIEDVGVFDLASADSDNTGTPELYLDQETKLTLAIALPNPSSTINTYRIERWALGHNPVYVETLVSSALAGDVVIQISDAHLKNIAKDDRILDTKNNKYYTILAVYGEFVYLTQPLADDVGTDDVETIEVHKRVFEHFDGDSDAALELLSAYNTVEIELYRPLTLVEGPVTAVLSNSGGSGLATGSFSVAAATHLEVICPPPSISDPTIPDYPIPLGVGVYDIVSTSSSAVVITKLFPAHETVSVNFYTPNTLAFSLTSGSSTVTAISDPKLVGVKAGDFFEWEDAGVLYTMPIIEVAVGSNDFILAGVAPSTIVPSPKSFAGRIYRLQGPK